MNGMSMESKATSAILFLLTIGGIQMLSSIKLARRILPSVHSQFTMQMRMASVMNMTAKELSQILKDKTLRSEYQIVDVREEDELRIAAIPDKDVFRFPLSQSSVWAEEIIEGKSPLEKEKATVCVCHHGMRSKRMADFLVHEANFSEVYNLVGGIHSYAIDADPSIATY